MLSDTLQTANNNVDYSDKTFTADADGDTYNVTDNLGAYRDNYREHTGMLNVKYAF